MTYLELARIDADLYQDASVAELARAVESGMAPHSALVARYEGPSREMRAELVRLAARELDGARDEYATRTRAGRAFELQQDAHVLATKCEDRAAWLRGCIAHTEHSPIADTEQDTVAAFVLRLHIELEHAAADAMYAPTAW